MKAIPHALAAAALALAAALPTAASLKPDLCWRVEDVRVGMKGCGKTVMAIAACEELLDSEEAEAVLIVADKTISYQWMHQIDHFTGGKASVCVIDGKNRKKREEQYREVLGEQFDYCIVSYSQVLTDWEIVRHLPADVMVCDEVTRIKSFKAKRAKLIKKMQPAYRYGLTGQPIENHAEEVYSIMEWIDR